MESKYCRLFVLLCGILSLTHAHNWLHTPVSRTDQRDTQTGCRYGGEGNPTCAGPCDTTVARTTRAPIVTQRGASLLVQWDRHNHPGGFIRFAWSPTSQSDSHASFDAHVQSFYCKDIGGCGPVDPSSPAGDANGVKCQTTINVPSFVTDGAWTFQWAYFGGYYNAGDYYACADYTISGGTAVAAQQSATFHGSDVTYPNSGECLFYSTNALHVCTAEPCLNGTFPAGANKGVVKGFTVGSGSSSTSTSTSTSGRVSTSTSTSTTGRPASTSTSTSTTGRPSSTSTSGRASTSTSTSTTGRVKSTSTSTTGPKTSSTSTTGKKSSTSTSTSTSTTGRPSSTSTSTSTSGSSSGSCTIGHMKCLTSESYSTCAHGLWGVSQPCGPGTHCSPSGDYIYCI